MNDKGDPTMAGEKMNLSIGDAVEVFMALIQIAICRFMVIRPDWWDSIAHKRRQWVKKIKNRFCKIIRKPVAVIGKTGACTIPPPIRYFDDEFFNLVFKEGRRSRDKKPLQTVPNNT